MNYDPRKAQQKSRRTRRKWHRRLRAENLECVPFSTIPPVLHVHPAHILLMRGAAVVPFGGGEDELTVQHAIMLVAPDGSYTGDGANFGASHAFWIYACIIHTRTLEVDMVVDMNRMTTHALMTLLYASQKKRRFQCAVAQVQNAFATGIPRRQKSNIIDEWQTFQQTRGDVFDDGRFQPAIADLKQRFNSASEELTGQYTFEREIAQQKSDQSKLDYQAVLNEATQQFLMYYCDVSRREDEDDALPVDVFQEFQKKRADDAYVSPISFINTYSLKILDAAADSAHAHMNRRLDYRRLDYDTPDALT
jgi:hypothetical protein